MSLVQMEVKVDPDKVKAIADLPLPTNVQEDLVQQCRTCALHRDNKPEPLIATPLPDRPWQVVATDLFQMKGMDYLIIIDCYSRYVEDAAMTKTTKASEVIRVLKSIFARHGIPEQLRSDNGPQYDSAEFSHFAKQY